MYLSHEKKEKMLTFTPLWIIVFFLGICVMLGNYDAYSQSSIQINISKCPDSLKVGERGDMIFSLTNINEQQLNITTMTLTPNGISQKNNSEIILNNNFVVPEQILSYSTTDVNARFSSIKDGIQYIDLNLTYELVGDNNHKQYFIQQELCKIEVLPIASEPLPLWLNILIGGGVSSAIAAFIIYLIKRPFVKKDFEQQQEIQHKLWLSQQMHALAEKYYFPLAKYGEEARRTISIASSSKESRDIKIAYNQICEFLQKYTEFKKMTGANFLFRDRSFENPAIGKVQAIMVSLPFDEKDINEIVANKTSSDGKLKEVDYKKTQYTYFERWIKSVNCEKSRDQTMIKLNELWEILDDQGERISQPDYFSKPPKSAPATSESDNFWILFSSSKYLQKNGNIFISGSGFTDKEIEYEFHMENFILHKEKTYTNMVELKIPDTINKGTYDLHARYVTNKIEKDTIRIVIHID